MLAACAAFDALERKWLAAFEVGAHDLEKEDDAAVECERISSEQDPCLDAIIALPCTTLEGVQAVAASLALWKPEVLKSGPGDTGECLTTKLVASLLDMRDTASDTELLALLPDYTRLKTQYDAYNAGAEPWVEDSGKEFDAFCMRVIAMPTATTSAGRAFKAQLALDQFAYIEGGGQADTAIRTVLGEVVAAWRTAQ